MIAPLQDLQEVVLASPTDSPTYRGPDSFLLRIQNALRGLPDQAEIVGPVDLAALLRQGILRCRLTTNNAPGLRVPRGGLWPDDRLWNLFDCEVAPYGGQHFLIQPRAWSPDWLDCGSSAVIEAAVSETARRRRHPIPVDPRVLELTGHTEYASAGQREAVRAAILMPAGSTLVINLPTGAGKTLAFQLPALIWASEGGLTLVIVPTVALAREQEERFRILLEQHPDTRRWAGVPLAYHGGLSADAKRAMRSGIRAGTIPIVFASPEAALRALRQPLFEAAEQGRLRYFVIDEAHIVSQWGQQFRPEFQSLSGLHGALLDACPNDLRFRTLLLTATLTPESSQMLYFLFGREDCHFVAEAVLRPEPGYLIYSATSEEDRREKLHEAIRYLPRPLILYTTLRSQAQDWYDLLYRDGYRRIALVRGGDLSDSEGDQILRNWQQRAIDIIVATSAFGLGVDQGDVRTVVHACLPETLDRYYQEVGRAGRDGNASVALLVSTTKDEQIAKGLAEEKLISVNRAYERWSAMWSHRRSGDDGILIVSLDERPQDIAETGDKNASWNLRTLVLMAQAGLIKFAAHRSPDFECGPDEDGNAFELRRHESWKQFYREVAIRLRDSRHSDRQHWDDLVMRTRSRLCQADREAFKMLSELRHLQTPLNDIFRELYTLNEPFAIQPPRFLGSCPVTRSRGTVDFNLVDSEVALFLHPTVSISSSLEQALEPCRDESGRCWVSFPPPRGDQRISRQWREQIRVLLRQAVSDGVVELALPDSFFEENEWRQLAMHAPTRFVVRTSMTEVATHATELQIPRLTLMEDSDYASLTIAAVMSVQRTRHIIVAPQELRDPRHESRRLFDIVRHLSLETLLARLGT